MMSFGGFLGVGHEHYPASLGMLDYNTDLGGFQVNITKEQVEGAPRYPADGNMTGGPKAAVKSTTIMAFHRNWV